MSARQEALLEEILSELRGMRADANRNALVALFGAAHVDPLTAKRLAAPVRRILVGLVDELAAPEVAPVAEPAPTTEVVASSFEVTTTTGRDGQLFHQARRKRAAE